MQIDIVGLYIKLSLENLESLLKIGEKINVKIIEKLDNNNYLVKIKGQTLRAYSTVNFKKGDDAILIVEKMKPSVILKFVDELPKDFMPANKLKIDLKKIDIKQLNILNAKEKQSLSPLKDITDKIKTSIDIFKNTSQTITTNQNNFFIQVPIALDKTKQKPIFIQQEKVENEGQNSKVCKKRGIRIVLYASPENLGDVKVDILYANKKINCSLFCSDKKGFENLNDHKTELEELLGDNTTINIGILTEKPTFLRKQIDLKI